MSDLLLVPGPAPDEDPSLVVERREADRHSCSRICYIKPNGKNAGAAWGVPLEDISRVGLRVVLRCQLQPGTVLAVSQSRQRIGPVLFAHVTRSAPHPQGWLHGCEFLRPLSEEALQNWLSGAEVERKGDTTSEGKDPLAVPLPPPAPHQHLEHQQGQ
jgi:hypothetical protein